MKARTVIRAKDKEANFLRYYTNSVISIKNIFNKVGLLGLPWPFSG